MGVKVGSLGLAGVRLIEPDVYADRRGFFMETYHQRRYEAQGIAGLFVQDNYSHSCRATLRGLHYQLRHPQAKLVQVLNGEVYDVVVDIRLGSPTFGKWDGVLLSGANRRQLFVPEGFAHGFCVLSSSADFFYKCTEFYMPGDEYGIAWNDADLNIDWPLAEPLVSDKDRTNPRLCEVDASLLPVFKEKS